MQELPKHKRVKCDDIPSKKQVKSSSVIYDGDALCLNGQGSLNVILKKLCEGLGDIITEEKDPLFTSSPAATITEQLIAGWNLAANAVQVTDFDYIILGAKDGINYIFTLSQNFKPGSTKVYLNGLRMHPGSNYDYQEGLGNQIIFNYPPEEESTLLVDYIPLNS